MFHSEKARSNPAQPSPTQPHSDSSVQSLNLGSDGFARTRETKKRGCDCSCSKRVLSVCLVVATAFMFGCTLLDVRMRSRSWLARAEAPILDGGFNLTQYYQGNMSRAGPSLVCRGTWRCAVAICSMSAYDPTRPPSVLVISPAQQPFPVERCLLSADDALLRLQYRDPTGFLVYKSVDYAIWLTASFVGLCFVYAFSSVVLVFVSFARRAYLQHSAGNCRAFEQDESSPLLHVKLPLVREPEGLVTDTYEESGKPNPHRENVAARCFRFVFLVLGTALLFAVALAVVGSKVLCYIHARQTDDFDPIPDIYRVSLYVSDIGGIVLASVASFCLLAAIPSVFPPMSAS